MTYSPGPLSVVNHEPYTCLRCITGLSFDIHFVIHALDITPEKGARREADAQRLASCFNALAGLPQEALDGGWNGAELSAHAKRMESDRADLLEALSEARGWLESHKHTLCAQEICAKVDAAITKATSPA